MKYKNYQAIIDYSDDDKTFYGRVLCTRDIIYFEGLTVEELDTSFRETLDDYFDHCKESGKEPGRPLEGEFEARITPERLAQEIHKSHIPFDREEIDDFLCHCGYEPRADNDDSRERFWNCWKRLQENDAMRKAI
jgi:predicted HicB family RNase H-like nuclease